MLDLDFAKDGLCARKVDHVRSLCWAAYAKADDGSSGRSRMRRKSHVLHEEVYMEQAPGFVAQGHSLSVAAPGKEVKLPFGRRKISYSTFGEGAEIEEILDHRVVGTSKKNTKTEFLIHLKGKSRADATWEKNRA